MSSLGRPAALAASTFHRPRRRLLASELHCSFLANPTSAIGIPCTYKFLMSDYLFKYSIRTVRRSSDLSGQRGFYLSSIVCIGFRRMWRHLSAVVQWIVHIGTEESCTCSNPDTNNTITQGCTSTLRLKDSQCCLLFTVQKHTLMNVLNYAKCNSYLPWGNTATNQ